jgi:hypothetical protein
VKLKPISNIIRERDLCLIGIRGTRSICEASKALASSVPEAVAKPGVSCPTWPKI